MPRSRDQRKGDFGEALARMYLRLRGYRILQKKYRVRQGEIDILARKKDMLVVCEVKTRSSTSFGLPAEAVSDRQWSRIVRASEVFIRQTDWHGNVRYDVIEVYLSFPPRIRYVPNMLDFSGRRY